MTALAFHVVDVFTDRPYAGNPLAVVLDADDLPTEALQAIAREFNLSETVFPMAASAEERAAGADYRLRIFTASAELPFAGHPSVGAAWLLATLGRIEPGEVRQACGAGVLPLEIEPGPGRVRLTGGAPSVGAALPDDAVLAAAGLAGGGALAGRARVSGTGLDWGIALVDAEQLAAARPEGRGLERLAELGAGGGVSISVWDAAGRTARTRVFAGDIGAAEDPATGSAALALGAYLVAEGLLPADGETAFTVVQGVEMGRPSTLECSVVARGGRAETCRVAGHVVPVSRGEITAPV
jgi:trans-2,3-dihydro-3-hydroxyanthranilate isomerase